MNAIDVAVERAASALEKTAGPEVALRAYEAAANRVASGSRKAPFLIGALRCAALTQSGSVVARLAAAWGALGSAGSHVRAIASICETLAVRGNTRESAIVALAERNKAPQARASYLAARCLERSADPRAHDFYLEAAELAKREHLAYVAAASLHRASRLSFSHGDVHEAIRNARSVEAHLLEPHLQIAHFEIRLREAGKYVRAAALSTLREIAERGPLSLTRDVARIAAHHVDALGLSCTHVELDHAKAIMLLVPERDQREDAVRRIAAVNELVRAPDSERDARIGAIMSEFVECTFDIGRARAALAIRDARTPLSFPVSRDPSELALWIVASRRAGGIGGEPRATFAIEQIATGVVSGAVAPPLAFWALRCALESGGPRDAMRNLANALFARVRTPPRFGYLALASLLDRSRLNDESRAALRLAAMHREPNAGGLFCQALSHHARVLADSGRFGEARQALLEARNLVSTPGGSR